MANEVISELSGKTIKQASFVEAEKTSNVELHIECTDGTKWIIAGWQREGYPAEMSITAA